jgi:hypothetical protein
MIDNPVSPVDAQNSKHNFSYPSRGNMNERYTEDDVQPGRGSGTIGSLKAAAVGLHVRLISIADSVHAAANMFIWL